jgi:hypothetical protein
MIRKQLQLALCAILVLNGCGGGGSDTPAASTTSTSNTAANNSTNSAAATNSSSTGTTQQPNTNTQPVVTNPAITNAVLGLPGVYSSVFLKTITTGATTELVSISSNWSKARSADAESWLVTAPATNAPTAPFNGGAFIDSVFFGFTTTAGLYKSSDAINWSVASSVVQWPTSIVKAAGKLVMIGQKNTTNPSPVTLATSTDGGTTWTAGTGSPSTSAWNGLAFGNNVFVAVGPGGKSITSNDGVTWVTSPDVVGAEFQAITFSSFASKFVAVGNEGKIFTSANGVSWTSSTHNYNVQTNLLTVECNTTICVSSGSVYSIGAIASSIGADPTAVISTDLSQWRTKGFSVSPQINKAIAQINSKWAVVGEFGSLITSTDGLNWARIPPR